jgi:intracellular sulfur oxidation DsrE/DsrF family protein
MRSITAITTFAALALGTASTGYAQSDHAMPIPHVGAEFDVPGAIEMPDPNIEYKVVFDIVGVPDDPSELNPRLVNVARFINTLAKNGVPEKNRQLAIVLHRASTENALRNDAYKARHDGHDNPNIELIRQLKAQGVDIRQCGQALIAREIDPADLLPEVQLDYWALTTLLRFQYDGYIKLGPN